MEIMEEEEMDAGGPLWVGKIKFLGAQENNIIRTSRKILRPRK